MSLLWLYLLLLGSVRCAVGLPRVDNTIEDADVLSDHSDGIVKTADKAGSIFLSDLCSAVKLIIIDNLFKLPFIHSCMIHGFHFSTPDITRILMILIPSMILQNQGITRITASQRFV